MKNPQEVFLSSKELQALARSLKLADPNFTITKYTEIMKWAQKVRVENTVLDLIVEGKIKIDYKDGQPIFDLTTTAKEEIDFLNIMECFNDE